MQSVTLIRPSVDIGAEGKSVSIRSSAEATPKSWPARKWRSGVNGPGPRHQGFVPLPAPVAGCHDPRLNTAMNHSIINGTGMGHPAGAQAPLVARQRISRVSLTELTSAPDTRDRPSRQFMSWFDQAAGDRLLTASVRVAVLNSVRRHCRCGSLLSA